MSSHQHPANPSWIWFGIHGASGIVHPFLAAHDDPNNLYSSLESVILAGSGGLLLIKRSPPRRTLADRLLSLRILFAEAGDQSNDNREGDQEQVSVEIAQHWISLSIVNPSTHEIRVLPPANSMDVGLELWSYNGVQATLLADTETQTYTVTLTFPYCVCLYTSTSNAWQCRSFNQRASWGPQMTSAYVNGRLFFADVVEDPIPTINLIKIDAEAGSWKLHNWRYSLQTRFTEFVDTPFLSMRGLTEYGMQQALNTRTVASGRLGRALPNFKIVECMGELYAVIPMSLSEYSPMMSLRRQRTSTEVVHEYANFGLNFMPLQFLIVNMRGGGFVHGVLRILLPDDVSSVVGSEGDDDIEDRESDLLDMLAFDELNWWFNCVAEGSVIWVELLNYVLQYDVVTGVSKTEIYCGQLA